MNELQTLADLWGFRIVIDHQLVSGYAWHGIERVLRIASDLTLPQTQWLRRLALRRLLSGRW